MQAAWEAKSEDYTRARFVHKISAWHRPRRRRLSGQAEEGGASAMEVDGQGLDEDSQHRLVEVVLTVLAERTLTVRALDRLTDAYAQEVGLSLRARKCLLWELRLTRFLCL
jgi:hypothetical protein